MSSSKRVASPTMRISLDPAEEGERATVEALLDAYLRELSGFRTQPIGDTSAAEYFWLSLYWSEPDRFPFPLRVDQEAFRLRPRSPCLGRPTPADAGC